jgi:putative membrane protein
MSDSSPATRLLLRFLLNGLLVWYMSTYLPQYFDLRGGLIAIIIVAALVTLLNVVVRPILTLITLPFRLFAAVIALIIVNGIFMWLVYVCTQLMDPSFIILTIYGGLLGWLITAIVFGLGNWMMRMMLK